MLGSSTGWRQRYLKQLAADFPRSIVPGTDTLVGIMVVLVPAGAQVGSEAVGLGSTIAEGKFWG